jgi:stalled ribosome alternative rescue factor ArfA
MRNYIIKRDFIAKALACKSLRMRVVAPKKGKGSYKRSKKIAA